MRSFTLIATLVGMLLSTNLIAQWHKIADFPCSGFGTTIDEPILSVYFLDLSGPPRIGFTGTESELYKTTDGGISWTKVWGNGCYDLFGITDICFKDSLNGWFSIFDGSGTIGDTACYRTTDGGNTWKPIEIPNSTFGSLNVYYHSVEGRLFLSMADYSGMRMSTDLGSHWSEVTKIETGGLSFFNDSMAVAASYPEDGDSTHFIVRTTDGGLTWDSVTTPSSCHQPLAIPGTSICFASTWGPIQIYRSDDYGVSWKLIKDFGPLADTQYHQIAPYGDGVIAGPLSRLSILTDWGTYVSTDEGARWTKEVGSPKYSLSGAGGQTFYSAKGITVAGAAGGGLYQGFGLWEESWPQASVVNEYFTSSDELIVCPNPASQRIEITSATGDIHLYDYLGRERSVGLKQASPTMLTTYMSVTLDVSHFEPGLYILRSGSRSAKVEIVR